MHSLMSISPPASKGLIFARCHSDYLSNLHRRFGVTVRVVSAFAWRVLAGNSIYASVSMISMRCMASAIKCGSSTDRRMIEVSSIVLCAASWVTASCPRRKRRGRKPIFESINDAAVPSMSAAGPISFRHNDFGNAIHDS